MRLLCQILISAFSAYLIGFWIMLYMNPECDFWLELEIRRNQALQEIRKNKPDEPVVLFAGGSSCAFSIDPLIITRNTGMPSINLGGPAHAGASYLVPRAIASARPGDLIVLALETHFLTTSTPHLPTSLGLALNLRQGQLAQCLPHLHRLRPGATFFATWLAKSATGNLTYRYDISHHRQDGRLEHPALLSSTTRVAHPKAIPLSLDGIKLIRQSLNEATKKNVTLVYSMPWQYIQEHDHANHRSLNEQLLIEISHHLHCLEDQSFGLSSTPEYFSDTINHLSQKGSKMRTVKVAQGLGQYLKQHHSQ
jgi:hypothetical protein